MFWRHVKSEHGLNEAAFKGKYSNRYIVHRTAHMCGLCAKEVTFDNGKLKVKGNKILILTQVWKLFTLLCSITSASTTRTQR